MTSPRPAIFDLSGRVAVVTGAAGGFGQAIGRRLSAAGCRLALWDRDGAQALATEFPKAVIAGVDVTREDQIAAASRTAFDRFGRIDILVNNAGVLGPLAPTWAYSEAQFRSVIDVNLIAPFLCARHIVPLMLRSAPETRSGRIVNVASIQGKEGMNLASAYSASKAGLIALTKSLARELATEGVLVNCITPAASMTAMTQVAPADRIAEILAKIPMGRLLAPEEVAAMVVWLCSSECSFTTGGVFDLSGGRATY